MEAKSEFLQIRVTPRQKAALKWSARQAGLGVSEFVLSRVLPPSSARFKELVCSLRDDGDRRYALAELNDLLSGLSSREFIDAVAEVDLRNLSEMMANYVAAMVEHAATRKAVPAPGWTEEIAALEKPYFATDLKSLRPVLLRDAPVAFKRRNIFVDSTIGDRV